MKKNIEYLEVFLKNNGKLPVNTSGDGRLFLARGTVAAAKGEERC